MYLLRLISISFIVFIMLFALWGVYDAQFSPRAIEGKRNEKLLKRLRPGQPYDSVIAIMGKPKRIHYDAIESLGYVYCYESNNGDYLDIQIEMDTTGKVYRIFKP